jgi:molybdopterin biosynthesis enzyme MoaB
MLGRRCEEAIMARISAFVMMMDMVMTQPGSSRRIRRTWAA